jgi:hypothetical protein
LQRAGFEEGPDAADGDADRVIAADRDAPGWAARHATGARAEACGGPGCPAPAAFPGRVRIPLAAATGGRGITQRA